MNKLVYLYELDSVNISKEEIEYAQRCMYEEILYHGNQVVLTFNQLTDSKVFLQVLHDKTTFSSIVELFRLGAFKVSCYKQDGEEISTASQYVQRCIEKCLKSSDTFLFSSLPMESNEEELLKHMLRSLRYSNLRFLREYIDGVKEEETKEKLRFIEEFTELILEISRHENVYIKSRECNEISLEGCIDYIIESDQSVDSIGDQYITQAKKLLLNIKESLDSRSVNSRSVWHNRLAEGAKGVKNSQSWAIAELFVDVSYNYVVENSIKGVSKDSEIGGFDGIFRKIEYQHRCWKLNKHTPLKGDSNQVILRKEVRLPKWLMVQRVLRNISGYNTNKAEYLGDSYVSEFNKELQRWRLIKLLAYTKSILYILLLVGLTWLIEVILSTVEVSMNNFGLERLLQVLLLLLFTTLIKSVAQRFVEVQDYSDSFQRVLTTLYDGVYVLFGRKKVGYYYGIK